MFFTPMAVLEQSTIIFILLGMITILFIVTFSFYRLAQRRKNAEQDLVESKRMLHDAINAIPVRVFWKDLNSRYIGCNDLFAEDARKKGPEEVAGCFDTDLGFSKEEADLYRADDRAVMDSGISKINYEEPQTVGEGQVNWINTSKIPLKNSKGETYGILGTYEDITPRKRIEEELREREERLRTINANVPGVLYQFYAKKNGDWGMNYVSEKAREVFDMDPEPWTFVDRFIKGVHPADSGEFVESIVKAVADESPWYFEGRFLKDSGELVYFRASSTPSKKNGQLVFHGVLLDVTETKNIQEQLHHSQKMEAIGQLAGGVAHDFNNMLGGIMMSAEIIKRHLPKDSEGHEFQKLIVDSARHASELTQKLLTFSRKQNSSFALVDVNSVVRDVSSILSKTLDKKIELLFSSEEDELLTRGDYSHLQSAVMNLGINASHVLGSGGEISFSTKIKSLDSNYCENSSFDLLSGDYVSVSVKDTGTGIEAEHLPHIFEPFFTTKDKGQGTGLGLAAVYGTVQEHKGEILVESELGVGTTFEILLPIVQGKINPKKETSSLSREEALGTVLVIDDEDVMRLTAETVLEYLGHKVLVAENGKVGLDVFLENQDQVDMIILDMIMPEMDGRTCLEEIRKVNQDIPVVLASGYTEQKDFEDVKGLGVSDFLAKPYSSSQLSDIVNQVLNSSK
ncbi:MAG: response regulator [Lentisphaeraceae bacterium]|nr:response regulator [Lentisphaeraceae bacterium]